MKYQVTSDNLEVIESMKVLADRKIKSLFKYLKGIPEDLVFARIVLNKGSADDTFQAKLTLDTGAHSYHADSVDFSLETALIQAVNDIKVQYKNYKEKNSDKKWEESRELKRFPAHASY
ncbi:MAG: HPF/RaiA family ribosome-associated protein [Patescibacteria group bacterium]|uniref:HPF/RaiA family ribosome-associated protein n=1 Tax=candidate division WWE3 bacterium TaxID=2053526 RepID=A0A955EDN3_UNCKA|nr:HPF/RaiA family ribosome-associated protein [candidate division WWE3 bacterium]